MKIAICLHPILDIGGIINHTEDLAAGLIEEGHKVDLLVLCNQYKFSTKEPEPTTNEKWCIGELGLPVHQSYGWKLQPYVNKIPYKGEDNLNKAREKLSGYDLIIWSVPVPTKQKSNEGNFYWPKLYDIPAKQIAIVHDGNLIKSTPWIHEIKKHFTGLACVHLCAYKTASSVGLPRALIFNPQNINKDLHRISYTKRTKGFLSLQTFKALKRVDELVRAVPYMSDLDSMLVAGGGLEYAYMTSKDKTKDKYFCKKERDPDLSPGIHVQNIRIWDRAVKKGMQYLGYISNQVRDQYLTSVRTLIDSSWNVYYAKHGGHFNRVMVEAMIAGALPIARNLGVSDNLEGKGLLFTPNKNYVMIPYNCSPKEFAELVMHANNLPEEQANSIIENNYELLHNFDRRKIAKDFINLSLGKDCGFYNKTEIGKDELAMVHKGKKEMLEFFHDGKG